MVCGLFNDNNMRNRIVSKLKRADWRAEFFRVLCDWHRCLIHHICTQWYRCKCRMMGVSLGNEVSFNGKIYIARFKHSTIIIGNRCTFNSHDLFNTRGIGNCIIRTYTDYARIEIGDNTGFSGVSINARRLVKLGRNVMVGAGVIIGDNDDHPERLGTSEAPIVIGDNVFVGMRSIIMKGVTIGDNSIIGAGSMVAKDIPANCVAAGVPCRVIRYND